MACAIELDKSRIILLLCADSFSLGVLTIIMKVILIIDNFADDVIDYR